MNADTFFLIKVVFGIIAAIFTLSAAVFTFLDSAQNEKTENTQEWFGKKWKAINKSPWLTLSENATKWLLKGRNFLSRCVDRIRYTRLTFLVVFLGIPILFFTACIYYWGYRALLTLILTIPLVVIAITGKFPQQRKSIKDEAIRFYYLGAMLITGVVATVLWLQIILEQNLYYSVVLMTVFIPFFWLAAFLPVRIFAHSILSVSDEWDNSIDLFTIGVGSGFTITLVAMEIGHLLEPSAYVPLTFQMLISNVIFDGFTMAITFTILAWALSKDGLLRLPIAILLDIVIAGIFAAGSLYFGLVFTDKALTLQEISYVLIARSPHNLYFEFSPYFWTMHTTFIPTLLYLSLILLCWTGKVLLIPVRSFCGLGQENKNPLKLTAGLCGIFAAVFAILFFVTGSVQERAKEIQARPAQPAIIENRME